MSDIPYEDAIDLLDADHKMVQQQFIDYQALCEDEAPAELRQQLAGKICAELIVHTRIEEDIFYPRVREAMEDDSLLDEAEQEHAQAKELIARIQGMDADDEGYDDTVQQLAKAVLAHVTEEREQIFLKARYSTADLRGMVPELFERKRKLQAEAGKASGRKAKVGA